MSVVLLGHSFIRRMRDELMPRTDGMMRGLDINYFPPTPAELFAKKMALSDHIQHVYVMSNRVNMISDLNSFDCTELVRQVQPDLIFMDIGSNDLACLGAVSPVQVMQLVSVLVKFAESQKTEVVIVCAILPRTGDLETTPATFLENMNLYNDYLFNICSTSKKLVFHSHRGITTGHDLLMGRLVPRRLEVSAWTEDGVHLNPPRLLMYIQRVRMTILGQFHRSQRLRHGKPPGNVPNSQ